MNIATPRLHCWYDVVGTARNSSVRMWTRSPKICDFDIHRFSRLGALRRRYAGAAPEYGRWYLALVPARPDFSTYKTVYPAQLPNLNNKKHDSELILLTGANGVCALCEPDVQKLIPGPPRGWEDETRLANDKYLWLLGVDQDVIFLETDPRGLLLLARGKASHTNLSGGLEAHAGGEVYFKSENEIFINGSSSRYHPRSDEEMKQIVRQLIGAGFRVSYAGWDDEAACARRFWRGPVKFFNDIDEVI